VISFLSYFILEGKREYLMHLSVSKYPPIFLDAEVGVRTQ
jgi:hypothetical protein